MNTVTACDNRTGASGHDPFSATVKVTSIVRAVIREMFAQERFLGYIGFAVPLVAVAYAAMHWEDLKAAFWLQIAGGVLLTGGILLAGRFG